MNILVTGARGFIGSAIMHAIPGTVAAGCRAEPNTDWSERLKNIDVVIHAGARVHVMNETAGDPLAEFRRANVESTKNLAEHAAKAGVKRFIYLSSIKVNGEATTAPFTADDAPKPEDAYGVSKYEAEEALKTIGLEYCVIRPPLVYGRGVKANFALLVKLVKLGLPLPFASIRNKRSFVALDNLVDLIRTCTTHPNAANQTFLVSDGDDVATPELMRRIAIAMGKKVCLLPVPPSLLQLGAKLVGKGDIAQRLCGNLQVDIRKTQELLGWSPPITMMEGLEKTI